MAVKPACGRCGGFTSVERDEYGERIVCLMCAYSVDLDGRTRRPVRGCLPLVARVTTPTRPAETPSRMRRR